MKKPSFPYINDTIAAVATPPGRGGLSIIRISGPRACAITKKIFNPIGKKKINNFISHQAYVGAIIAHTGPIDRGVVVYMKAPNSYTGEDVVEITTHGAPVVVRNVLSCLAVLGVRMAEPGEFTKRAFLNNKIDLAQAEAVADLIRSKTDSQAQSAYRQMTGIFSQTIQEIRKILINLSAEIEVQLDHAEEDVEPLPAKKIVTTTNHIIYEIDKLLQTALAGKVLKQGLTLAIIGKPNAGKSKLLNAILNWERSIVTDEPGTTRDTVDAEIILGGIPVTIIDTAGIRSHSISKAEILGIQRSRDIAAHADIVLAVFDLSTALTEDDIIIADIVQDKKNIAVFNKCDLTSVLSPADIKQIVKKTACVSNAIVSALTGEKIDTLKKEIIAIIEHQCSHAESSVIITNVRHEQALKKARKSLCNLNKAVENKESEECIAFELSEAMHALDEITGTITTEDVLNTIFSQFCIGK